MFKKSLSILISLFLICSFFVGAVSAEDEIKVYLNGQQVQFDQKVIIVEGSTLVPMRAFFTSLDASVIWDQSTRTITSNRGDVEIKLTIDSDIAYRNGKEILLSTPAKIINNSTYVPLRFVGTALGDGVAWDSSTRSVRITSKNVTTNKLQNMNVHFIDVGQGDATLIQSEDFVILIDAGRHDRNDVVSYLKSSGIDKIDLLVLTHPHADHIGQADKVLNEFKVDEVWASGNEHTSRTFERVLDAIIKSNASYVEPIAGEKYQIGPATVTILHPGESLSGDLNNDSVSFRLDYGDISFIFTGDAEKEAEESMINSGLPLKAHILHVGHHGSNTSSTQKFLNKVRPKVAIYSAGKDNSYGHPHEEIVKRYNDMGIVLYGTDVHGTIILKTDGTTYEVITSKDTALLPNAA